MAGHKTGNSTKHTGQLKGGSSKKGPIRPKGSGTANADTFRKVPGGK